MTRTRAWWPAVVLALSLGWTVDSGAGAALAGESSAPTLEQIVDRVEQTCQQTQDLSARFQQTATNRTLGQVQEASGLFQLKRPGMMRWEYVKPDARLFVTDGKQLWVYSPADKQVMVQEIAQALASRIPLSFLAGDCQLRREFSVGTVEHSGTRAAAVKILDLKPKAAEAGLARLLLEVSLKSYTVEKATLFDAYGNTTVIAFSSLKLNPGLDDAQFRFVPPPGVKVISPGTP